MSREATNKNRAATQFRGRFTFLEQRKPTQPVKSRGPMLFKVKISTFRVASLRIHGRDTKRTLVPHFSYVGNICYLNITTVRW